MFGYIGLNKNKEKKNTAETLEYSFQESNQHLQLLDAMHATPQKVVFTMWAKASSRVSIYIAPKRANTPRFALKKKNHGGVRI